MNRPRPDDGNHDQDAEPTLNAPGDEGPTGVTASEEDEDEDDG